VSKELIERADRFYAVARELEADAAFTLRCAEMLNRHADAMCELNMKNQKAACRSNATTSEQWRT